MSTKSAIGIDIGGTKICAAIINNGIISGKVLKHKTPKTAKDILDSVIKLIEELTAINKIASVGIATAGAVNKENSKVIGSTGNLPEGYADINFKKIIEEKFNLKTFVENDANAAAYAEYKTGASKGHQNTITITLGTGIGGGIIIEGELLKGKSGAAAEVGHLQLSWKKERQCTCGSWDCWESYGSGTGYKKTAQEMAKTFEEFKHSLLKDKNPENLTTHDIIEGRSKKDQFCQKVHEKWEEHLLMGLIALANIFDPESIVLSGGMAKFVNFQKLEEIINKEIVTSKIQLLEAKAGNHAGMIGAAILSNK